MAVFENLSFFWGAMKNTVLAASILSSLLLGCSSEKNQKVANAPQASSIIGGVDVHRTDSIASFTVGIFDQENNFICSGSLIKENVVLTAGHCIETKASNLVIVFDLNFSAVDSKKLNVLRKVTSVRVHPGYKDDDSIVMDFNDLAVIEFDGALPEGYKPIEFLKTQSLLARGTAVHVAGFGANEVEEEDVTKRDRNFKKDLENGEVVCDDEKYTHCFRLNFSGSETLRTTEVEIQGFTEKEIRLNESKGHGTCVGDSGGPLFFQAEGAFYLVGVTSRGNVFCDGPAVYTNALEYLDWIQNGK